ncbi:MAG TPA: NnrS family protein [Xanthomonadaceae bacterium]|nr:NnrS family protein [Xanthomonadaceae bacterium]
METIARSQPSSTRPDLRLFADAPHRLAFLAGAAALLLAMAWWALWLADQRWHLLGMRAPQIPAGWAHAVVMLYQVFTPFIFGFLLTVFPRWMNQAPVGPLGFLPAGGLLLAGYLVTVIGLFAAPPLVIAGMWLTLAGWVYGLVRLAVILWQDAGRTWHALSCGFALLLGATGLALFLAYAHGGDARLAFASIKLGGFGFLLPVFFTVCHRMLPFFASCVIPGYRVVRPMPALALFWAAAFGHVVLELAHAYAWMWLPDLALLALGAWLLWHWWPRAPMPGLLAALFLGFAWLPAAMALYAAQSLWFAATGEFILGRAPLHALAIGFFGSLLVAMVTRVTLGHSGRPLAMSRVAWFGFIAVQIVAVTRIVSEFAPGYATWQALSAFGWLIAFLPWALRCGWIWLTPRADGRPG